MKRQKICIIGGGLTGLMTALTLSKLNFKIEIDKILTPLYFDNQKKLSCIISSMNMIKLLTVELQENLNIYKHNSICFEYIYFNLRILFKVFST